MKYIFDALMQKKIIKYLIVNNRIDYVSHLYEELFDEAPVRMIFRYIKYYATEYMMLPTFDLLAQKCGGSFLPFDEVPKMKEEILTTLEQIKNIQIDNTEIGSIVKDFIVNQESRNYLMKVTSDIELGNINLRDWQSRLNRIIAIDIDYKFGIFVKDFELESRPPSVALPTHLRTVNDWLKGGLRKGELGFVVGESGIGKTYFLILIGIACAIVGKNVFYYSLELTEDMIYLRVVNRLTGFDEEQIHQRPNKFRKKLNEQIAHMGEFYIKDYPTKSATVNDIRGDIEIVSQMYGIYPDLVIVDYCDIIKPSIAYKDDWEKIGDIANDLRRMAGELNVAVWTASQIKSEYYGKDFTTKATGRSMEKVNISDVMIGIVPVNGDEKRDVIRQMSDTYDPETEDIVKVKLLKVRRAKKRYQVCYVKMRLSQCQMIELQNVRAMGVDEEV